MKRNYTAVIIDDEQMARILLQEMLAQHLPEINVVATCEDLPNGVKAINKHQPNLVFLDIQMPGHSGLELLEFFPSDKINFATIYTTAYQQYAIDAIKQSAAGYLLKPIEVDDLIQTVRSACIKIDQNLSNKEKTTQYIDETAQKIALTTLQSTKYVYLKNILYFKAIGAYTEVKLTDETTIVVSKGLKKFETILMDYTSFFRCHKSYIINCNYIAEHIKRDGGYLILSNKEQIPISSERIQELNEKMNWLV